MEKLLDGERVRVVLCGASGNMGKAMMSRLCCQKDIFVVAVDKDLPNENCACYQTICDVNECVDMVVDFSHASVTDELLDFALSRKIPLVIATTGQSKSQIAKIKRASKQIPIFFSGNMSLGIAMLAKIAKMAVALFPFADVEIVETHHTHKSDVPSGTSLMIANAIQSVRPSSVVVGRHKNGQRKDDEIGISSLRLGCDVGKHEVIVDTGNERLTFSHQAYNRALYAEGAVKAMQFIATKEKGLFDVNDILDIDR